MRRDFALPDVGEGLEEATVVDWLVAEGDEVTLNQPVCLIETAKAEVELPSPYAGQVTALMCSRGDTLRVGETLMSFELREPRAATAAPVEAGDERQPLLVGYGVEKDAPAAPRARAWRRASARGDGDAVTPEAGIRPDSSEGFPARPLAAPPVRRLAKDLGVDLSSVSGSGPDGHVLREDVRAAASPSNPGPGAPYPGPPAAGPAGTPRPGSVVEVRGTRLKVAQKMAASRSTIPEATCAVWVDFSSLLALQDAVRASLEDPAVSSTITPFSIVVRLAVLALWANPILNSSYDEPAGLIRVHPGIDLGIATNTAKGLLVPVLRQAQERTTLELAGEMSRLTQAAREGGLAPDELRGSTFTISNFGSLGLDDGIPVINYPEAAILGVGAIRERPVVVDGLLAARSTAKLVCSFDHRVCDGAEAGRFLRMLQQLIEEPERALFRV
jgi:2-oxoisovalerate dehydrogenase E2 component (dihydrolipoyl transacylase)